MRRQVILKVLVMAGCFIKAGSAIADGAVAVGISPKGGYAIGIAINKPDEESARQSALDLCRKSKDAPVTATSRCEVLDTFRNKCVASAIDPGAGTPGEGWAIAETQRAADVEAMKRCKSTAGPTRQSFCKVTDRRCDGTAH